MSNKSSNVNSNNNSKSFTAEKMGKRRDSNDMKSNMSSGQISENGDGSTSIMKSASKKGGFFTLPKLKQNKGSKFIK